MKNRFVLLCSTLLFIAFISASNSTLANESSVCLTILGDLSSKKLWVYLCGLTCNFDSQQEFCNREKLNRIGRAIGVKFIAVKPVHRCKKFDNKLCWPHNNDKETLQTYREINQQLGNLKVLGFIGFSNGGFFLNKLSQLISLNVPIISIGSGGYITEVNAQNKIYLLIGTADHYHFDIANKFATQAKETLLEVELIVYESGHVIPEKLLRNLIKMLAIGRFEKRHCSI